MRRYPLIVLVLILLAACEAPVLGPSAVPGMGGGMATASVITVVPAGTTITGVISAGTLPPQATPEPPTPLPTLASATLTPTELKYKLLEKFPNFFFCDPDYYPVARDDETELARERFPELQNNQEEFQAILQHLGLSSQTTFADDQKLTIYREHKRLAAIRFELFAGQFQFQITTGSEGQQAQSIQGLIDGAGHITVQKQTQGFATCPICLAAHTRIETPRGQVFVEDVRVGQLVWTLDAAGQRVAEPVVRVARVPVSAGHVLLHVVLDDGRQLWASPGHPTSGGQPLAALHAGDMLDGAHVLSIQQVAYDGGATYDLLPAGGTGLYWADGILMGSTLKSGLIATSTNPAAMQLKRLLTFLSLALLTACALQPPPTLTEPPLTPQPGLIIRGYVRLADGSGLANVSICRNYASYPGTVVATTDASGYFESQFAAIPGDEMVGAWAVASGYNFRPDNYRWRHYYGSESRSLDFIASSGTAVPPAPCP